MFFAIQTEIAQQVKSQLGTGARLILLAERDSARRERPSNLTAYEYYLLGGEKLDKPDKANLEEAIRLFRKAAELDPKFARAWIGLAGAYDVSAYSGIDPAQSRKLEAESAQRAVDLDPSDAAAHMALGYSFGVTGDFVRGKAEFETALRLAPGSAEVLTQYAGWAATFGEPARGGEMADQAIRLDPNYAEWAANRFSYAYFASDRYADALRVLERGSPDNYTPDTWIVRTGALAALGRIDEAKSWVEETLKRYPNLTAEGWANEPGYAQDERDRFLRTMKLAGFPPCAKPEALSGLTKPVRLQECTDLAHAIK
jgi:Flp pilus assembly protein TadD